MSETGMVSDMDSVDSKEEVRKRVQTQSKSHKSDKTAFRKKLQKRDQGKETFQNQKKEMRGS